MSSIFQILDGSVWAMTERSLDQMQTFLNSVDGSDVVDAAGGDVSAATGNRGVLKGKDKDEYEDDVYSVSGATATVPVYGKMFPRANMMTSLSGGVSTSKLGSALDEIEQREDIEAAMMMFDSPGGSVKGLTNLARKVREMDTETVAFAEGLMASAAYFVGSAADQVIASPDSMVGAIGSVATIKSRAKKLEEEGYEVEVVRSAEKKAKPNPSEPIDEDSVKEMQRLVNSAHDQFVRQVAINLNLSEETVSNTMADGSVITGAEAEDTDFVDEVATLDEVMASYKEGEDQEESETEFLRNEYKDLRNRHQDALDEIEDLRNELTDLREAQREAEIESIVQTAIYDEQKFAPAKEDDLRAQLENNFEATKQMIDLMDEGSAAPSPSVQPDTERRDDPVTQQEAFAALRNAGYKVAVDDESAQTFERFNEDYVAAEDAVDVAQEKDLL